VHAVRLGGRRRLDASRVFFTDRSQDLLVVRRALAGRKSVAPPDAGRGWVEGETVRVREVIDPIPHVRLAGFGLQALDTTEGVLGLCPACSYRQDEA